MSNRAPWSATVIVVGSLLSQHAAQVDGAENAKPHPYRLPDANLKQHVIWGSTVEAPDGTALSFGGEDQQAEDGRSHTRLRVKGQWVDLKDELNKADPTEPVAALAKSQKDLLAKARFLYLDGKPPSASPEALTTLMQREREMGEGVGLLEGRPAFPEYMQPRLKAARSQAAITLRALEAELSPDALKQMRITQVLLEEIHDLLSPEPPARALSPLVYEPKTQCFVLFGGDHCDYLTSDTWVFDLAARRWSLRHPASAPRPRANHTWAATGDGKLTLTGGYTYFSNTDYMGGQYIDMNDGPWTYDVVADTWTGAGETAPPDSRTYRTGPFLPEFFFDAPKPSAADFQAKLEALPANVWTKTNPPKLPQVNRDWGTAVIDPDRDLILRFSGGHCAHGGTDVLQYHLSSNRWELCYPVEFPLGQLYSNTSYPDGFNFNHRPWVSGHTYQNYGVDPVLKKMLFLGHPPFGYVYDPDLGDWTTRVNLPKGMDYYGAMYTLTTTSTPQGLCCWTEHGQVFRFDAAAGQWHELHLTGEHLPGAVVDSSTVVYDSHRDRLLFLRTAYGGKPKYDGEIYALEMKSLQVTHLSPAGMEAAGAIPYLPQVRYDTIHDLLLVGATLAPDAGGVRRTPGYDCKANKWVTFKLTGDDPSGKEGRNVSLGMMYDGRRKLFWGVDTRSQVFVLRFDPKLADEADLARH